MASTKMTTNDGSKKVQWAVDLTYECRITRKNTAMPCEKRNGVSVVLLLHCWPAFTPHYSDEQVLTVGVHMRPRDIA